MAIRECDQRVLSTSVENIKQISDDIDLLL